MPPKPPEKLIDEEDEVLQAVILADSFDKRFRPLTTRTPRCLLPICNAPLLDWTFESLALAGVQEIFVVCRSHADKVKQAIADSKWSRPGSGIKIVPILTAKETFSAGDAMRDVYTRGLITTDFVLVMGDLVSNIRIDDVVRVHKERCKKNKNAIMTMVVKESGADHRTRTTGDRSVFVLNAETSECLHYEAVAAYPPTKTTHIPREILEAHPEIEIRNDLIDCSIDVCSVEVPSLFQDNFDYEDLRKDFLHGVLTSDLLMKNIYCYVAQDGYAARVKDTKSYDSISKDILSRWTFPLVPDDNHPGGHVYQHTRGNKYVSSEVTLARTCKIGNNTLIGASTKIHDDAQVSGSVIGRNCIIGAGSIIEGAYIFDGTIIGAQCIVRRSIIGAGVTIRDKTHIERGCIVGDGVAVGPSATVQPFERLSKRRRESSDDEGDDEEEDDSDLEDIEANQPGSSTSILGTQTNAIVWPQGPGDDDDEDAIAEYKNQRLRRIADDGSDLELSDDGSESADESDDESESSDEIESSAVSPEDSDIEDLEPPTPVIPGASNMMEEEEFRLEVEQSLERAFSEGHSVENAAVELKTLRMASNVPLGRVREAVVAAIVEAIPIVAPTAQKAEISRVIGRWGPLIDHIGGVDAVETLIALQTHCSNSERFPLFGQILSELYQTDVVEEDDIRTWLASPTAQGEGSAAGTTAENMKRCWAIGTQLQQQLAAMDSESESGSDEEEEEEEDVKTKASVGPSANESESESDDEEEEDVRTKASPSKESESGSGSEEEDEEEEEEEEPKLAQTKAPVAPPTKESESENSEADEDDEDDEEDEDESEEKEEAKTVVKPPIGKMDETESESGSEEESSEEEGPAPKTVSPSVAAKSVEATKSEAKPNLGKNAETEESESGSGSEEESSEEESAPPPPSVAKVAKPATEAKPNPQPVGGVAKKPASESEEESEEEESSEADSD